MRRRGFIASLLAAPLMSKHVPMSGGLIIEPKKDLARAIVSKSVHDSDYILGRGVLFFSKLDDKGRALDWSHISGVPSFENLNK